MMKRRLTLLIDESKMRYPELVFDERLARFLLRNLAHTVTKQDIDYYAESGVTVAADSVVALSEPCPEEQAMQPLWEAVRTIRGWRETELIELKSRWFALAEEAVMTAIHRVEQAHRADVLGRWPMDEFLHAVWALITAMHERGVENDPWFGQNFHQVRQMLAVRGLNTDLES